MPEKIRRTTARVVPVSSGGACLLLLERDPARPAQETGIVALAAVEGQQ